MLTDMQRTSLSAFVAALDAVFGGAAAMPRDIQRNYDAVRIRLLEDAQQRHRRADLLGSDHAVPAEERSA